VAEEEATCQGPFLLLSLCPCASPSVLPVLTTHLTIRLLLLTSPQVKNNSDAEAIRMANNCEFALSSCAFSGSAARARRVASQLHAGMSAVNDLEVRPSPFSASLSLFTSSPPLQATHTTPSN